MPNTPDIVVGTWGMSAFDTASSDTPGLITSLHRLGVRRFDAALVYGNGSIDRELGALSDAEVITKIPALRRDDLKQKGPDFSIHYPRDHVRASVDQLLSFHGGNIHTLLFHNWHPSWCFDQVQTVMEEYAPNIQYLGVSARQDELSPDHGIPLLEIPIDPVIHRLDTENNLENARILVRSIFCHGLLLYDIQDTARLSRFTPEQLVKLSAFRSQYPTVSARMQAALGYICSLPLHIQAIIVGITREQQWRDISESLQMVMQSD